MRHETPMGSEPLTRHRIAQSSFLLSHISNVISLRIHDHVFIRLFETTIESGLSVRWRGTICAMQRLSVALTSSRSSFPADAEPLDLSLPGHL